MDRSFYWFTLRSADANDIHDKSSEEIENILGQKKISGKGLKP